MKRLIVVMKKLKLISLAPPQRLLYPFYIDLSRIDLFDRITLS